MKATDKADSNKESGVKVLKPSSPSGCKIGVNPQQQKFEFEDLTLDSCFDSGNMSSAVKASDSHYHVWIAPDCYGTQKETDYRTWFYFRAKDMKKYGTYTFTVKNMNFQGKLFNEGLLPVYRPKTQSSWKKVEAKGFSIQKSEKGLEVTFTHTFGPHDVEVFFAFTYPWSYEEDQNLIDQYEREFKDDSSIYFKRELLAFSRENRRIELLTISSHSNKLEQRERLLPNLFPGSESSSRPFMFNKKYVFISSRVHPGETPASHVFKGLLRFVLDKEDLRAQAFRDNFVIVLIPMLNPDGVYRGHYRTDTHGLNLNRYYTAPVVAEHPSIYATRQIVLDLNINKRLFLYCDLHAHATKRGCFVYGNNHDYRQQVETLLFPKLLSLNSQYFEYDSCDFSEKNVNIKDRGDGKTKEGAGRVALCKATDLVRCYTLECNYGSGKYKNVLSHIVKAESHSEEVKTGLESENLESLTNEKINASGSYSAENFEEIGEGIGPALLDMIQANPQSRIFSSVYKSLKNVKLNLALNLLKEPPFRFDVYLRKVNKTVTKNFDALLKYLDDNIKFDPLEDQKKNERCIIRKSRTVPPQVRKKPMNDIKEPSEIKGLKEIRVVNILPPIRGAGVIEQMGNKRKLPKSKTLITKKTTTILPPKTGFSIVKKMTKS